MADDCTSDFGSTCDNTELIAAINTCCSTQNANLTTIATKLETISTEHAECCTNILAKFDTMISLLTEIANK